MRSVGLPSLALLAESDLAIALYCKGCGFRGVLGGKQAVAVIVGRGAGRSEDGGGVGPVEEEEEKDGNYGRSRA